MKSETAAYLDKGRALLDRASALLARGFVDDAGRAVYLAGFHAAQAFIFEAVGRSPKTHGGVRAEFSRLTKDEPAIDLESRAFLGRAYNLKAIADYETGPGAKVTPAQAAEAIAGAKRGHGMIRLVRPASRDRKVKRAPQIDELAALEADIDAGLADVAASRLKTFAAGSHTIV